MSLTHKYMIVHFPGLVELYFNKKKWWSLTIWKLNNSDFRVIYEGWYFIDMRESTILYFFFWPLCCLFFFDIRIGTFFTPNSANTSIETTGGNRSHLLNNTSITFLSDFNPDAEQKSNRRRSQKFVVYSKKH
jgi:hypothetical protein